MALKTPPALARTLALLAPAVVLASCGGGTTGSPIAATTATMSAPAATTPTATTATTPAPPTTPATTPRTTATEPRPARPRPAAEPAAEPTSTATETQPEPAPEPAGTPLDETAELTLVERAGPAHYFQQGTVTGTYDGTMEAEARITSKGIVVHFTATVPGGTIRGRALAIAIIDGSKNPPLKGTALVTGGTGRFAGITGRRLRVSGRSEPDASHSRVRLTGTVDF